MAEKHMYTSKADALALCGSPNHVIVYVMATGLLGLEPIATVQGVPHALIYLNISVF